MPSVSPFKSKMGRRYLSTASGLEPRSAEKLRSVAARMIAGESVTQQELVEAAPGRLNPLSLGIGYDWREGKLVLEEAYRLVENGVGVMDLAGPIQFNADLFDVFFFGAIPSDLLVEAFKEATGDSKLKSLVVRGHCPGGSVFGCTAVAAAVDAFRAAGKKLTVIADSMLCSAAVHAFCVADRICVTESGIVGSVGTISMRYDDSAMWADMGVVPMPIASAERKSQGWPGVKINDDLADDERRLVAKHWSEFKARVAKGRGISQDRVEAMEARIYLGSDAVDVGLADEVIEFEPLLARLVKGEFDIQPEGRPKGAAAPEVVSLAPPAPEEVPVMPIEYKDLKIEDLKKERPDLVSQLAPPPPSPATVPQLKAEFPGSENAEFREECIEKGRTLDQAKAAYSGVLNSRLSAADAKAKALADENANMKKLGNEGKGVEPLSTGPGGGRATEETYISAVNAKAKELQAGGMKAEDARGEAMEFVARTRPDLHEDWKDGLREKALKDQKESRRRIPGQSA